MLTSDDIATSKIMHIYLSLLNISSKLNSCIRKK